LYPTSTYLEVFFYQLGDHLDILDRKYSGISKILPIFLKICEKNMALEKKINLLKKRVTMKNKNMKLCVIM
jgi:hypothetical protein